MIVSDALARSTSSTAAALKTPVRRYEMLLAAHFFGKIERQGCDEADSRSPRMG
jgi:hypothetical protein